MISEGEQADWIARHNRGGYLARLWVHQKFPKPPGAWVWCRTNDPVAALRFESTDHGKKWMADERMTGFGLVVAPVCACCGTPHVVRGRHGYFSPYRCEKHAERNPCAIEGCRRTREAPTLSDGTPRLANNQVLCSEHWRRFVPPRSRLRTAYHSFWRTAKRQASAETPDGWTDELHDRFVKFWRALIRRARRRATQGFVDEAEIAKLMGWDTT